jgi:hypothetical protein
MKTIPDVYLSKSFCVLVEDGEAIVLRRAAVASENALAVDMVGVETLEWAADQPAPAAEAPVATPGLFDNGKEIIPRTRILPLEPAVSHPKALHWKTVEKVRSYLSDGNSAGRVAEICGVTVESVERIRDRDRDNREGRLPKEQQEEQDEADDGELSPQTRGAIRRRIEAGLDNFTIAEEVSRGRRTVTPAEIEKIREEGPIEVL